VTHNPNHDEQLEIMKERLTAAGMDRRTVLKVAAAASAGVVTAGAINYGDAAASPLTGRKRLRFAKPQEGTPDADQTFYHTGIYEDPTSFDWNLNLYCNAEEETFAGVLTFNENLEAVADWAETFGPNEDASVWTFNIRKDNKGWTDGRPSPPATSSTLGAASSTRRPRRPTPASSTTSSTRRPSTAAPRTRARPATTRSEGKVPTGEDLGVRAIDDWTLEVTMEGPRAYFPQVVAYQAPSRPRSGRSRSSGDPGRWPRTASRSSPTAPSRSTSGPRARCFGCRSTRATGTPRTSG
jgi:ABC-type transport system substrate-binding protein